MGSKRKIKEYMSFVLNFVIWKEIQNIYIRERISIFRQNGRDVDFKVLRGRIFLGGEGGVNFMKVIVEVFGVFKVSLGLSMILVRVVVYRKKGRVQFFKGIC